jgi:integrase
VWGKGEEDRFGFTGGVIFYETDPTQPIGNWKEAWEKAKKRAGAILRGNDESVNVQSDHRSRGSLTQEQTEANYLKCRFHDLRHTAVTRLLEAGIPYPVMASMMGWSAATAIRMAKRYGHIGSHALQEAADVLGRNQIPVGSLKKSPKPGEVENAVLQ